MKKHRNDVCRLAMLLAGGEHPAMSKGIRADMQRFMEAYESDPVDPKALKIKGVGAQQVVEVTGTSTCSKAVPDCIPPVFSATLGCSGMHRFVCSKGRTRDELLSCWLAAISFYGGVPEEWVADNMSAIVTFDGRRRGPALRQGGGVRALPLQVELFVFWSLGLKAFTAHAHLHWR